jgi:ABC-type branched-subunit amino acid transport system ATPase component
LSKSTVRYAHRTASEALLMGKLYDDRGNRMSPSFSTKNGVRTEMPDLAVILVEHEMDVIRRVSDRCVVLNFARKIFEGTFDVLIADAAVQTAYLGTSQ